MSYKLNHTLLVWRLGGPRQTLSNDHACLPSKMATFAKNVLCAFFLSYIFLVVACIFPLFSMKTYEIDEWYIKYDLCMSQQEW
jgi:hypothetical protein